MDAGQLEARKTRARAWFESLRDDICAAFEGLEDGLPAGAPRTAEAAGRFVRTPWTRTDHTGAPGGGGGEFHSEPTTPPSAPSTASVRVGFTDNAFTTTDGEALPLRTWLPQGDEAWASAVAREVSRRGGAPDEFGCKSQGQVGREGPLPPDPLVSE